jgi:hypothetical protein
MKQRGKLSYRMRWAVPAGIMAAVGGVLTTSMISLGDKQPAAYQASPASSIYT